MEALTRIILFEFQHLHWDPRMSFRDPYAIKDAKMAECHCNSSKAVTINLATDIPSQIEDFLGKHATVFRHAGDPKVGARILDARIQWTGIDSPSPDLADLKKAEILHQLELMEKRGYVDRIVVKFAFSS